MVFVRNRTIIWKNLIYLGPKSRFTTQRVLRPFDLLPVSIPKIILQGIVKQDADWIITAISSDSVIIPKSSVISVPILDLAALNRASYNVRKKN